MCYKLIIIVLAFASCNRDVKFESNKSNKVIRDNNKCSFTKINEDRLLYIDSAHLLNNSDSCLFAYFDRVSKIKTKNQTALIKYDLLNYIYQNTNSQEVKLSFNTLMIESFYTDFDGLSYAFYCNKEKYKLTIPLVESLSINIADSTEPEDFNMGKNKVVDFITRKSPNDSIKAYLLLVIDNLKPENYAN